MHLPLLLNNSRAFFLAWARSRNDAPQLFFFLKENLNSFKSCGVRVFRCNCVLRSLSCCILLLVNGKTLLKSCAVIISLMLDCVAHCEKLDGLPSDPRQCVLFSTTKPYLSWAPPCRTVPQKPRRTWPMLAVHARGLFGI